MFLSVKEMELRKIRFDETFEPGRIDFSGEDMEQGSPLRAAGGPSCWRIRRARCVSEGGITVEMTRRVRPLPGAGAVSAGAGFDLFYRPVSDIAREEEVEIDEGEAEIGFYEDGGMELEDILREQVLLALPMQRVCSEACKGICPVCGRNRNETACDCRVESADDRWGALRNLEL